jgi:transposase
VKNTRVKQYSADLRERLLGAIDAGLPVAEGARLFGVCPSTIRRWRCRKRTTGSVGARPRPGRSPRIGPTQALALQAQIAAHPDATLAMHCAQWEQQQGVRVSVATMSRVIRRLGITLKKSAARERARRPTSIRAGWSLSMRVGPI